MSNSNSRSPNSVPCILLLSQVSYEYVETNWNGAALAITFLLSSLLINSIKYYTNFSKDAQILIIISYVNSKYLVQHFPYACYLSPGVHHCSITTQEY